MKPVFSGSRNCSSDAVFCPPSANFIEISHTLCQIARVKSN
ncbi:hypothetical protein D1AOALGA4SA_5456 [Olavius algarvensis Delta 1 endosymbiont]|nr:hypothetical protein D1AOALGA4SA_5456 [Olavius algarvensis Delta 1 endosymbiont]